jgi:hypothetical protein
LAGDQILRSVLREVILDAQMYAQKPLPGAALAKLFAWVYEADAFTIGSFTSYDDDTPDCPATQAGVASEGKSDCVWWAMAFDNIMSALGYSSLSGAIKVI